MRAGAAGSLPSSGIAAVEVRGVRSARDVSFSPGPVCALVGEGNAGKSNLLAAIRAVLDPSAVMPEPLVRVGDPAISLARS